MVPDMKFTCKVPRALAVKRAGTTTAAPGLRPVGRGLLGAAALVGLALLQGCAGLWSALAPSASTGAVPTVVPPVALPVAPARLPSAWQTPLPTAQPLPNAGTAASAQPLPHGGTTAGLAQWWAQFDDPLLPELITAAQAASPSLASAAARVERSRAARTSVGASGLPQASTAGSATHGRSALGQRTGTSVQVGVQAQWELDLFGAVAAGRQAAQARFEGAQALWHEARVSVAAETATSYVALRACEAQVAQSEVDTRSRIETARLTDASAAAGFTAPADAALARASAAQARSSLLAQRAQCDTLVKSLVDITDSAEPSLRQRLQPRTARLPVPPAIGVAALPAQLLAQRPDLAEAARAVLAAAADTAQAQARERPQISLSGSLFGVALTDYSNTVRGTTWSLGPLSINFPLFDGGSRAAATVSARAGYDEAVALYQAAVRRAVREVEVSLVALQATAARQADVNAAARDFEASLRATEARRQGGLASQFDLETARRNAVLAQSSLIELERERSSAWIALYRALGGGWSLEAGATVVAPSTGAD